MSVRKKFKHWLGETTGLVTSCLKEDIWEAKDAIRNKNGKKLLGREFIVERAGTEPDRLRACVWELRDQVDKATEGAAKAAKEKKRETQAEQRAAKAEERAARAETEAARGKERAARLRLTD